MLFEVLSHLGVFRYGASKRGLVESVYDGECEIEGGILRRPVLKDSQYFVIIGSTFNDGAYQHPVDILTDEVFSGQVFSLRYNSELFALIEEIKEWTEKNAPTMYQSESFGGYSYSKDVSSSSWKSAFKERLSPWRKV